MVGDNTRDDDRTLAWCTLIALRTSRRAKRMLLEAFGSPAEVVQAGPAMLSDVVAIPDIARRLRDAESRGTLSRDRLAELEDVQLVACDDVCYPFLLRQIPDPPIALFVRGRVTLLREPQIAIVGARRATVAGVQVAHRLAVQLSGARLTVVSGLARGIDVAAHRGALSVHHPTIAVLGSGIDVVYPRGHTSVYNDIVANGLIVSEYLPGTPPFARQFPERNRLISGLAVGVVVVEAGLKSGSLVTARFAAEQGREVFAVPGSVLSAVSKGVNKLLRDGASVVETAEDVLIELSALLTAIEPALPAPGGLLRPAEGNQVTAGHERPHRQRHLAAACKARDGASKVQPTQSERVPALDDEQGRVLALLGRGVHTMANLLSASSLELGALQRLLFELELKGLVKRLPNGAYESVRR